MRGKFGIFCGLDISKVISTGYLFSLQTLTQAFFQNGDLLLFLVRQNRLVRFASGPQYGTRVWRRGQTEKVTPYAHADPHRSKPTYEVAALASLLGTIEFSDAKQRSGSTRTFEVRYTDKISAVLAMDFTARDIVFTAAVPNPLLRNQLINSISELLKTDCSEQDKALVSFLQVGSPLGVCTTPSTVS